MIFYGECSILDKTVFWKVVYENLGIIKVVVIKLSLTRKESILGEGGLRYRFLYALEWIGDRLPRTTGTIGSTIISHLVNKYNFSIYFSLF